MARRIADEQGWTLGREVGWHVRFERKFTADTRVLFATEGILTSRLQQDPLLSGLHDDRPRRVPRAQHPRGPRPRAGAPGVARARRPADRVMSATLQARAARGVSRRLPADRRAGTAASARDRLSPGAVGRRLPRRSCCARRPAACCASCPARRRSTARCPTCAPPPDRGVDVLPLHGSLPADEQDRAIAGGRAAARDSRDQHRRDVADRSRRDRRRRRRPAEGRALRSGSRHRLAGARADSRRRRRAAGRPRRPPRSRAASAGCGIAPIGSARTASRRSTASICPTRCSTSSRGAAIRATFEWFDAPSPERVDAALRAARAARRGARRHA